MRSVAMTARAFIRACDPPPKACFACSLGRDVAEEDAAFGNMDATARPSIVPPVFGPFALPPPVPRRYFLGGAKTPAMESIVPEEKRKLTRLNLGRFRSSTRPLPRSRQKGPAVS